ncbi:uncharacterized protein LOC115227112 [Octopus sinensis]|uniref:Uncharacterized protein LOC115227112 n=1 Tax=Octopus sinensis TaxID=2607531 RepID=A0A6P7TQ88_9MOLL|nr:uncharacterized protein LOC115227112 [Octopus sinensis]
MCRQRDTWLLQDSCSYGGLVVDSDHKIVIGRFNLKKLYVLDKTNRQFPHKSDRYLTEKLAPSLSTRNLYKSSIDESLKTWKLDLCLQPLGRQCQPTFTRRQINMLESSQKYALIGLCYPDALALSVVQKELKLSTENTKDMDTKLALKGRRAAIQKQIKTLNLQYGRDILASRLGELEALKDNARTFMALRLLKRKKNCPKLRLQTSNGVQISDPGEQVGVIADYFEQRFNANTEQISPFSGPARRLKNTISLKEVTKAVSRLKNINAELLKYGPESLLCNITNILNDMFATNDSLPLGSGVLIPIQKPNKPLGPVENLRPVILLNSLRKVLSLIVLDWRQSQ